MKPQCFNCGKFVSAGKGETAKLKVKEAKRHPTGTSHVYLCKDCIPDNLDRYKTYPWFEAAEMV